MSKSVFVKIRSDGAVVAEAHGIKGPDCEEIVRQVLDRLGSIRGSGYTPEYLEAKPDQVVEETH